MLMMARNPFLMKPRTAGGGAPPTFFAAGAGVTMSGGQINVANYASQAANDIAFIWCVASGPAAPTINDLTGWTGLTAFTGALTTARLFWKRLTGVEGTNTLTFVNATIAEAVMIGLRSVITSGTPYEGANTSTGLANPSVAPTIVTAGTNRLALRFQGNQMPDYGVTPASPPTGYTEAYENWNTVGSDNNTRAIAIDYKTLAAAGTESASSRVDDSGTTYVIQTLAVLGT